VRQRSCQDVHGKEEEKTKKMKMKKRRRRRGKDSWRGDAIRFINSSTRLKIAVAVIILGLVNSVRGSTKSSKSGKNKPRRLMNKAEKGSDFWILRSERRYPHLVPSLRNTAIPGNVVAVIISGP